MPRTRHRNLQPPVGSKPSAFGLQPENSTPEADEARDRGSAACSKILTTSDRAYVYCPWLLAKGQGRPLQQQKTSSILARSNLPFCRSGLWLASTRARFSGSASAVSESCLLDSMTFARSSRAIARYPTWVATTTSRQRRPWASTAQGSAARGLMRPFSPGATSFWIAAA